MYSNVSNINYHCNLFGGRGADASEQTDGQLRKLSFYSDSAHAHNIIK